MKKILVPTDFSSCASNAINFAVQTAKLLPGIQINLLHILDLSDNLYNDGLDLMQEMNEVAWEDAQKKLDLVQKSIEETEGITINTIVEQGVAGNAIVEWSEKNGADLVVMGTFGINGLGDRIWGSKTAALIAKTKIPVMVIPYEYNWKTPQNFLFATNHFEEEPGIIKQIFDWALLFKTTFHVAVFTDEDTAHAVEFLEHQRNIAGYEQKLKKHFNTESITAHHLVGHKLEDTLHDYIGNNKIDILSMVTYQRNMLERIFHPSITRRMSYHTTIPLLVIPAKK